MFIIIYANNQIIDNFNEEYTPKNILDDLYYLLEKMDKIFRTNNIKYWIDAGTLLGAVRHNGIIPWDDDIDICIMIDNKDKFLALRKEFNNYGIDMQHYWADYKLFLINGNNIKPNNRNWEWTDKDGKIVNDDFNIKYKYPFIDIMFMIKKDDNYIYHNDKIRYNFPKHYYESGDLFPLKEYKFNKINVYGPNNPYPYLNRCYPDWKQVGIKKYDHQNMRFMNKIMINYDNYHFAGK